MRKECCYGQKNFGSICSSLSPSLTYLSHTTNINPFENKVWEVYFYKEVYLFVHWSSSLVLTMFPLIFVYVICICIHIVVSQLYNSKRQIQLQKNLFTVNENESWLNEYKSIWELLTMVKKAKEKKNIYSQIKNNFFSIYKMVHVVNEGAILLVWYGHLRVGYTLLLYTDQSHTWHR